MINLIRLLGRVPGLLGAKGIKTELSGMKVVASDAAGNEKAVIEFARMVLERVSNNAPAVPAKSRMILLSNIQAGNGAPSDPEVLAMAKLISTVATGEDVGVLANSVQEMKYWEQFGFKTAFSSVTGEPRRYQMFLGSEVIEQWRRSVSSK